MQKTLLLGLLGLVTAPIAFGQSLFVENFAYAAGTQVGGTGVVPTGPNPTTGWATHSGITGQLLVGGTGMTFTSTPAYPSQTGGSLALDASTQTEDINQKFAEQTSGSVYVSAMVTPTVVPSGTNGSYFLHVASTSTAGSTFRGRVFMAAGAVPNTVKFGVSVAANVPTFAATEYALGTKLLIVLRYDIVAGATNDLASIYIFEEGANISVEPGTAAASASDTGADPANIGSVALRQGTTNPGTGNETSGGQNVDGVRVGLSWMDAPLPVELNAFTGQANGTTARLAWTTASETNNLGFYVEQQDGESWNTVSGLVAGHGTTTERNAYTFDVNNLTAGTHTFRLRQVDTDGTVHYSPTTTVEIAAQGGLALTALGARGLRVESENGADVSVYDLLGRRVMAERVGSGTTVLQLDGVSSGVYVVRAEADGRAVTTRLVVR